MLLSINNRLMQIEDEIAKLMQRPSIAHGELRTNNIYTQLKINLNNTPYVSPNRFKFH